MTAGTLAEAGHLVRRFFGHLRARPLSPVEQQEVRRALSGAQAQWFFRMDPADQRHSLEVARAVRVLRPGDTAAHEAALLHDVGKSAVDLGAVQRSLATLLHTVGLPMPASYRRYRAHGVIGADILRGAGASPLTIAFAQHHPGAPPAGVDPAAWADLEHADHT